MTCFSPFHSFAWQDSYKPLAILLPSEGRDCTQISPAPSEHTDTSRIALIPHHAKTSFCIWEPHLGCNCFFPTTTHPRGSPPRPRMWQPWLSITESLTAGGGDGWSAAASSPARCLSHGLAPALRSLGRAHSHPSLSHMKLRPGSEKESS